MGTALRALVTGGHKRLGRAITLALAQAGYDVCIHYRHDRELAETAATEVRALGRRAAVVGGDLSDTTQLTRIIDETAKQLLGLDLVVACAASYRATALDATDAAHFDQVLGENARAPIDLLLHARPWLQASGDGRAVVIGDLAGTAPYRGYLAHSMAKAALHMGVRGLAAEWAPHILVNGVVPGAVLAPTTMAPAQWAELQSRVPLGISALSDPQLPVRAVVDTVLWLAKAPRFITGQLVAVDGGRMARW
jgi:NAD(P)-dependent dehydrogenase (short-subunit alcohol dehydrogenase family)